MEEALAAPEQFGPHQLIVLRQELLQALIAGNEPRLVEVLSSEGQTNGHVAINVEAAAAPAAAVAPPGVATSSCLLGVDSDGNTALHLVASRGHAQLAAFICQREPSLVATRNRSLDTPLHCAAKAGRREVVACLLSAMRAGGEEAEAALRARNSRGATALYEAVGYRHLELVKLLMTEAPELFAITTVDGCSPLYLAALIRSLEMVRAIVRPSSDGTPSPASYSGPNGLTALHAATYATREIVQEILNWQPEGRALLTKGDSSGKTPLHHAILRKDLGVIDLFLDWLTPDELVLMSDHCGIYPVHVAAQVGSTEIMDKLLQKFPGYYEMVDHHGHNLLHWAVDYEKESVVRYICQNASFSPLLNAVNCYGSTPLHLAASNGFPRIVSLLLQTMTVKTDIANNNGLTPRALAVNALPPQFCLLTPRFLTVCCLIWSEATMTSDEINYPRKVKHHLAKDDEGDNLSKTGTIGSVLIATVAFAAAFTVPGGYVADDHPSAGAAVLARRFAFRAFVVSDTLAFLCSAIATCYLIHGGTKEVPRSQRARYSGLASLLLPLAALFTVAAFAFGLHLVLGDANRGLIVFVYMVCSATAAFFCFPDIWVPLRLGLAKAVWRRAGWRGFVNMHNSSRSSSPHQLLYGFLDSFLVCYVAAPFFVVLVSASFVVAIALNIALPNY